MSTDELKKLAEDAAENGASIYHNFYTAANPAAILELLAINAELVEALKNLLNDTQHSEHFCSDPNCPVANAIAALAKAEGGEL